MKRALLPVGLVVVLAGCFGGTTDATADPTAEPTPEATPEATDQPSSTAQPSDEPAATPEPTPLASQASGGTFVPATNAEADSLFVDPDSCQNLRDGYQLVYPDSWYTNTEFRDVAACSWFSPTFYEVDSTIGLPEEIAISIEWVPDLVRWADDPLRTETGLVGGQNAVRVEFPDEYFYVIQLGPTPEEGPNLIARTAAHMGGDYELNQAVLDRLMYTIEFVGSVQ